MQYQYTEQEWRQELFALNYFLRIEHIEQVEVLIAEFIDLVEAELVVYKQRPNFLINQPDEDEQQILKIWEGVCLPNIRRSYKAMTRNLRMIRKGDFEYSYSGDAASIQRDLNREFGWYWDWMRPEIEQQARAIMMKWTELAELRNKTFLGWYYKVITGSKTENLRSAIQYYTVALPDGVPYPDVLPIVPYKGMRIKTGEPCPQDGEWIAMGDGRIQRINYGEPMPYTPTGAVEWMLHRAWSQFNGASRYEIGYRFSPNSGKKIPITGIWKAVNIPDTPIRLFSKGKRGQFLDTMVPELNGSLEARGLMPIDERPLRGGGDNMSFYFVIPEWELIYII